MLLETDVERDVDNFSVSYSESVRRNPIKVPK